MSGLFLGNHGGRSHCYRFFEDMMLCVKEEGIHRQMYKCREPKADYYECLLHKKKIQKYNAIKEQKAKLIKEGKWPPKDN